MKDRCITRKKIFISEALAEDVLIEHWSKQEYSSGQAPIAVYRCDDCGNYHLTSRPPMNSQLAAYLASDKVKLHREANKWLDKLKGK